MEQDTDWVKDLVAMVNFAEGRTGPADTTCRPRSDVLPQLKVALPAETTSQLEARPPQPHANVKDASKLVCKVCGRGFANQSNLLRHRRMHLRKCLFSNSMQTSPDIYLTI